LLRTRSPPASAAPCVPVLATDPLISSTLGNTGNQGVVRDNGGHLVA